MENLSPAGWVPILLFVLLGCFFLQKAIRPRAPQTWGWGRGGGEVPVSRAGYGVIGLTFLDIAALLAYGEKPPVPLAIILLLGFIAIIVVGTRDTIVYRRGTSRPGKNQKGKNRAV